MWSSTWRGSKTILDQACAMLVNNNFGKNRETGVEHLADDEDEGGVVGKLGKAGTGCRYQNWFMSCLESGWFTVLYNNQKARGENLEIVVFNHLVLLPGIRTSSHRMCCT